MKALRVRSGESNDTGRDVTRALENVESPTWILTYVVDDYSESELAAQLPSHFRNVPMFGATSFRGVFSAEGFGRGAALLIGEAHDGVEACATLERCGSSDARTAARETCAQIRGRLNDPPRALLLHATPGFEERILEGIDDEFDGQVPVYGGSAADDAIEGNWRVFADGKESGEGFVLVAFAGPEPVRGAFTGGYLPTSHSGTVTRADGRILLEIDGRPAAVVYDEWTNGALTERLRSGGNVVSRTALHPLGRVVGESLGTPTRILAQPFEVAAQTQALRLLAEVAEGEVVTLMTTTRESLASRMGKAADRALSDHQAQLCGGVFFYCSGCLGQVLGDADRIAADFARAVGDVPFVGAATLGQQGSLAGERCLNRHGNLMNSTLLFG